MQVIGKNQSKKLTPICFSDLCPNYIMVWYSGEGLLLKMFQIEKKEKNLINQQHQLKNCVKIPDMAALSILLTYMTFSSRF